MRSSGESTQPSIVHLPTDDLTMGLDFRLDDDAEALAELAASIAELGVLQPLVVRRAPGGWEVVAGRRRLAAARASGLATVPCVVRGLTDDEAADVALAENVHRRQLSPIEEALAYARLRDRGLLLREIGARVGRTEGHVSRLLSLLTISQALQEKVHRREMSTKTALERAGRSKLVVGGMSTHGVVLDGDTVALVTHWRRRHDRLLAGIYQVLKADDAQLRAMLERLLKVDREPLPERGRVA